eukprot:Awhi_evm2s8981
MLAAVYSSSFIWFVALNSNFVLVNAREQTTYLAATAQVGSNYSPETIVFVAQNAADIGAQIVVFPENADINQRYPSPSDEDLCVRDSTDPVNLVACASKDNNIYIVHTLADSQPCAPTIEPGLCFKGNSAYPDGYYSFTASVVFGPEGNLITKYYKNNLFTEAMLGATQPTQKLSEHFNATGTFVALGVEFGLAICNDMNDRKLLQKYADLNIEDILYSNSWENSQSQQTMESILTGISHTYGLNVVAASTSDGGSGSGVYSNGEILISVFDTSCVNFNFEECSDAFT